MRIMGLDLGDKKIGVAVSDPLGITALGLEPFLSRGLASRDAEALSEMARKYGVNLIVVGLPRNMDGSYGPRAQKTREFAELLKKVSGLEVVLWDERLTTVTAEKLLISAGTSRAKRKKINDKLAAVLILQSYLSALENKRKGRQE